MIIFCNSSGRTKYSNMNMDRHIRKHRFREKRCLNLFIFDKKQKQINVLSFILIICQLPPANINI